jgi:hypothetical protein
VLVSAYVVAAPPVTADIDTNAAAISVAFLMIFILSIFVEFKANGFDGLTILRADQSISDLHHRWLLGCL